MKFGKFLVIAAVLCMAVGASAQMTVHSGAMYDWVISPFGPVGDGSENLVSVILSIVNNTGNPALNPQAYDSLLGGFGGIQPLGPRPKLHQHHGAAFPPFPPTPTATLGSPWADSIDTHFLFDPVDPGIIIAPGGAPAEDYLTPSLETPTPFGLTDFGSFLTGTFAIAGAAGPQWDLAQIVMPRGTWGLSVDTEVAAGNGASERATFHFAVLPEPATPAALPMGFVGLALIGRRRGMAERGSKSRTS